MTSTSGAAAPAPTKFVKIPEIPSTGLSAALAERLAHPDCDPALATLCQGEEIELVLAGTPRFRGLLELHAPSCEDRPVPIQHVLAPDLLLHRADPCGCWPASWHERANVLHSSPRWSDVVHELDDTIELARFEALRTSLGAVPGGDPVLLTHAVLEEVERAAVCVASRTGTARAHSLVTAAYDLLRSWAGGVELGVHVRVLAARADSANVGVRARASYGASCVSAGSLTASYHLAEGESTRIDRPELDVWLGVADELTAGADQSPTLVALDLRAASEIEICALAVLEAHGFLRARAGDRAALVLGAALAGALGRETRGWVCMEGGLSEELSAELLEIVLALGTWQLPMHERRTRAGFALREDLATARALLTT